MLTAAPRPGRGGDLLALLAGALLPLAFAPFNLYPLAVIALAVLFRLWRDLAPRRAFWRGWLFGLGQFGAGISWVYISIDRYGNALPFVAPLITVFFVLYLALFPGLVGYLSRRLAPEGPWYASAILMSTLWVLAEWLRGWLLTGFPWLFVGYSQIDGPLAGLAPVTGVYGVSLAAALSGALLAGLVRGGTSRAMVSAVLVAALWSGAWWLRDVSWVTPLGDPLRVALVQGNTDQALKWRPAEARAILDTYRQLSEPLWGRDLVIWPETAVPMLDDLARPTLAPVLEQARAAGTTLVYGVPTRRGDAYFNSIVVAGAEAGRYDKRHLVPFGEYFPLRDAVRWLNFLDVPMSDFSAGTDVQPLPRVGRWRIGMSICYEVAYSELMRTSLPDAALLVTVSNDAWFGDSLAPHQHLQIARMRALEAGRYFLRATNTGITAIIGPDGRLQGVTPQFRPAVLTGEVTPLGGATPYTRLGSWPTLAGAAGLTVIAWLLGALVARRGFPRL